MDDSSMSLDDSCSSGTDVFIRVTLDLDSSVPEKKKFTLSRRTCSPSHVLSLLFESTRVECVSIGHVDVQTFERVCEFMEHHCEHLPLTIPKPLPPTDIKNLLFEWDFLFFARLSTKQLLDLMMAADFLDVTCLIETTSAVIASMIRGKCAQEIRNTFGIENDFVAGEEDAIRAQNKWIQFKR